MHTSHIIILFFFFSTTATLFLFLPTVTSPQKPTGNTDKWLAPSQQSSSEATTRSLDLAESCPLRPLTMRNSPGCVLLREASASQLNKAMTEFERALKYTNFKPPIFEDLMKQKIIPLTTTATILLLNSVSKGTLRDSNFCLGEYDSTESFYLYKGVCQELPLSGHKWSVFGFALSLGPHSLLLPSCTGFTGGYASFCLALAKDCSNNPSIAFSFNPYLFKCRPFNPILSLATSGLSRLFVALSNQLVTISTFGISFSNSFVKEFEMSTGLDVVRATMQGTVYTSGSFEMKPRDFSFHLPNFMRLRGGGTKVLNVEGLEAVEKTVDWINRNPLDVEKILKSLEYWDNIAYRLYMDIQDLKFDLLFNELNIGMSLPDFKDIDLGKARVYVSNAPHTKSVPLPPGIYINANGISGEGIRPFLEVLLKHLEEPLAALQQWLPFQLTPSQILNLIDLDALNFEFALSVTGDAVRFMIWAPLLNVFMKFIKITCVISLGERDIRCVPETGLTDGKSALWRNGNNFAGPHRLFHEV